MSTRAGEIVRGARSRLRRPLGVAGRLLLLAILAAAAAWLFWDRVLYFAIAGDDFAYLSEARDASNRPAHLFSPHNAHVVPLFRLQTYAAVRVAGSSARLPGVLRVFSLLPIALLTAATGLLAARETRSSAWGWVASALVALSTVMEPSVAWYSAGQTLWAALACVVAILGWSLRRSGWTRLGTAAGLLATAAAPWYWAGGYAAGAAGCAYLWCAGGRARRAAWLPIAASLATAAISFAVAGPALAPARMFEGRAPAEAIRPLAGLADTARAIPEFLVLRNLGLDVPVDKGQGILLCAAFAVVWRATRRRRGLPALTPLEAAGATLVVVPFALAFAGRAYLPFNSLREAGWYQSMPQTGWSLLLTGWIAAARGPRASVPAPESTPGQARPLTRGGACGVLILIATLAGLQKPRADRLLLASVPPLTPRLARLFPIDELRLSWARFLASMHTDQQAASLAGLDRLEAIARATGVGRDELHRTFGRVTIPGWPPALDQIDALDLLRLPARGVSPIPPSRRADVIDCLRVALPPRPQWYPDGEEWPPRAGPTRAVEE